MNANHDGNDTFDRQGFTLNSLKEELFSLNMRMLLAMQNHDNSAQEEVKRQMADVQTAIEHMKLGKRIV